MEARLAKHNLSEHHLLIHGGWNAYKSNTPHSPLTLLQIAMRGADFYAAHPHRDLFDRVWFFDSLDSADEVDAIVGLAAGSGEPREIQILRSRSCEAMADVPQKPSRGQANAH